MKIIIESHIPYIKGLLEPWAQVVYLDPEYITPATVSDAQVLIVRTRTRCDEALLAGSKVEVIATATIGTDHIDLDYCHRQGITVYNASGCNAPAVAQWVHASIALWMRQQGINDPATLRLGIVGVGHVGSIVARWASQLGFQVVLNDPPRGLIDSIQECDIITYHTPLTHDGDYPTWHLCNASMLNQCQRLRLILNASRGAVCDNVALERWHGDLALDCWEGEPDINPALLRRAIVATPHIAGYSIEGKQRGTAMIIDALNRHYGWSAPVIMPPAPLQGAATVTQQSILDSYNPLHDTTLLRNAHRSIHPDLTQCQEIYMTQEDSQVAPQGKGDTPFESQRNNYPLRPEHR